jgi:hypothetical protein
MLAMLCIPACVIGVRGEAAFEAEHELAGIDELQVDLPSTPLSIVACDADVVDLCPTVLRYDGVWMSTGGTGEDARRNAARPALELHRDDAFARLTAHVPIEIAGLVELEMGEIRLPDDRHLDLRTSLGDVEVLGARASVAVDVEVGDVTIRGGDGGVGVRVGLGFVDVETSGHADLRLDTGDVRMVQTTGARDLHIFTGSGSIDVELASDADLELEIHAPGTIRVQTGAVNTITSGGFSRRTGNALHAIDLRTESGNVTVRLAE